MEREQVVAGGEDSAMTLLDGAHAKRLDGMDAEGFDDGLEGHGKIMRAEQRIAVWPVRRSQRRCRPGDVDRRSRRVDRGS